MDNNSFWNKIKLNLFCLNDNQDRIEKSKKAWKRRIAIILGKLIWIIIDKLFNNLF